MFLFFSFLKFLSIVWVNKDRESLDGVNSSSAIDLTGCLPNSMSLSEGLPISNSRINIDRAYGTQNLSPNLKIRLLIHIFDKIYIKKESKKTRRIKFFFFNTVRQP